MTVEFYKKHRPKTSKHFAGNASAKKQVSSWIKNDAVPHFIIFNGPSGCGKTTLARMLRESLGCGDGDFREINAAGKARGIDEVKTIEGQLNMSAISGKCRVYLIDEAQKMTNDAQNAILKMTEDTPKHVYFIFCTTDIQKLLPTIRTRASVVSVEPLSAADMGKLLGRVAMKEDVSIPDDVRDAIVSAADGSPRKALVLLNQIAYLEPEEMLDAVEQSDEKKQAIDLCRLLMNPKTKWKAVADVLKNLEGVEPESFRYMMLAYATNVCLGGGRMAARAFVLLDQFSSNYYDTKRAGLVADCYEVVTDDRMEV